MSHLSNCSCDGDNLIRKQREEIILLTNQLKEQEEQICLFQQSNSKLKINLKLMDKKVLDYESKVKNLNQEIQSLKNANESLKQKLNLKDLFLNNQSKRLQKILNEQEKSNQQHVNMEDMINDIKSENLKFKLNTKEQTRRITELKAKIAELLKTIESKNLLIKISSQQITLLENSLKSIYDSFNNNKINTDLDFANDIFNFKKPLLDLILKESQANSGTIFNLDEIKDFLIERLGIKNEDLYKIINNDQNEHQRTSTPIKDICT